MPSGFATSAISFVILTSAADGRGVAGGVVVDEDEGARRELERPLHHLARVDRRMVDGSGLLHLVGDEGVALVEEQEPELSSNR